MSFHTSSLTFARLLFLPIVTSSLLGACSSDKESTNENLSSTAGSGGNTNVDASWPSLPDGSDENAAGSSGSTGGTAGAGGESGAGCPCLDGVDNYCLYWPHDIDGCDMLLPGGYCDPDGDGDFADADWVLGFEQYASACGIVCGDSDCSTPSENCSTCPEDCGECAAGCPNGECDGQETCVTCPQDCGTCEPSCGNGTCDGKENCITCPTDCPKAAAVACSKLGAHNIGDTLPFYDFLDACPRIAKWLGGEGSAHGTGFAQFEEMAAYKCACGGTTVLRIYGNPANYSTGGDLWNARYKFLETASPSSKAAVDYLESDNECDAGHCWFQAGDPTYAPSIAAMQSYATFLSQWIDHAAAHGFKPLVGNLSVGAPGGDVDSCTGDGMQAFGALVPALLKARDAGGGWAYHSYTDSWETDAGAGMMPYLAFRYRKFVSCFPELSTVPLIMTEAGFDKGGNAQTDGYLVNGGWGAYGPWLSWYQGELAKDSYVLGALLYSFSPPGVWDSFRLDGHVSELAGVIGPATCAP